MIQTKLLYMTAKKKDVNTAETASAEKETDELKGAEKKTRTKRSVKKSEETPAENKKSRKSTKAAAKTKENITAVTDIAAVSDENSAHKKVPDAFVSDLLDLARIFEANPGITEPIRDVFEYHLVDPIDRKTFPRIVNAMSMLLGPAPTMVLMTGCHVNSAGFFEDLLEAVGDNKTALNAVWIMQHLTAIYGNRVQKAYSLSSGTMDEDWHTIDVNTFKREGEISTWVIDMNLAQYSGTEVHLKMTPDSAYQLIDIIMTELIENIPMEQVDIDLIEKCRKHCKEYYEKFYGKVKTKTEDEHPAGYA
ncbi:MAG: hypothetical protein MJ116_10930 [Lachnospiraceae bacterium]|nr:hypothetical protein [Lachnospiraceae bacterium]